MQAKKISKEKKTIATVTSISRDQDDETEISVGETLQKARKSLRKRIGDVSKTLRISETYLSALEENRAADLPERVYATGFIRTYSRFLGLDEVDMTRRFCEEVLEKPSQNNYSLPISYSPKNAPSKSILKICFLLVVILSLGWVTFHQWSDSDFVKKSLPFLFKTSSVVSVDQKEKPLFEEISGVASYQEPETPVIEEEVEAFSRHLKETAENARSTDTEESPGVLPDMRSVEEKEFSSTEMRSGHKASSVQKSSQLLDTNWGSQGESASTVLPSSKYSLVFEDKSWIEIRRLSDNTVLLQKTFFPNQTKILPEGEDLSVRIGNAGGVRLSRGNKVSKSLGHSGQVLTITSLGAESLKAYF